MDKVKTINNIELLFERLLIYLRPSTTESQTFDYLFIFEFMKVYFKIKEMTKRREKMLKTTEYQNSKKDIKVNLDRFDTKLLKDINSNSEALVPKIKQVLKEIEKCKSIVVDKSNALYKDSEILCNSNLKVAFPEFVNKPQIGKSRPKSLHYLAELIYTLRPLAYCYLLKYYGSRDTKPYVVNLLIDLLWLLINFINYGHRVFRKKEIKHRIYQALLLYLLRNPVFENIIKKKVLFNIIRFLIRNDKVRGFVLKILDTQMPFSYTF